MDILLLSISGGLATLSILALVWVIRYSSRKRERLFMLEHIVRRNDWNISKLQCLRSKVLAFISKGNKLIIIDTEGVQQSNVIDLADIRECRVIVKSLSVQLELIPADFDRPSITVPFFRRYSDPLVLRKVLSRSATIWKNTINEKLTSSMEFEMGLSE